MQSDFVNRGQALVASGQYQEAVKVCRLGLLGRPTTVEGRIVLGQALLALKRFDEVLAEMRVAIELDHTAVAALVLKGEALLRKGDPHAALESLQKARAANPSDPQISQLIAEAERGTRAPAGSTSHPAVGFVRDTATRGYVGHQGEDEGASESFTKPALKSARMRAALPNKRELGVGDKSGTVEVDPEMEGVELDEDDIGALSPPPSMTGRGRLDLPRGSVQKAGQAPRRDSGVELDAEDLIEDDETPPPVEMRGRSAVRSAVGMKSGPIDQYPPSLAQAIAGTPHVMQVTPVAPSPQVPTASPRAPTMVPQQMMPVPPRPQPQPQPPQPQPPPYAPFPPAPQMVQPPAPSASHLAAALPTMALTPAQLRSADAVDSMFRQAPQPISPSIPWAQSTVVATGPNGTPGGGVDPALAALAASVDARASGMMLTPGRAPEPGPAPAAPPEARAMKTGMRRTRSKLKIVLWVVLGGAVIGGGVFAGFQIRAMRLGTQIDSARTRATALAKQDTWAGWAAARDGLAGIVSAANTADNRAALARARAEVAFELGDGLADAKAAVDAQKGEGGLEGQLAAAYLALASDDPKAAKTAADAALAAAPADPAALYVAGRAQLLGGDASGSLAHLKAAADGEPRALYAVGLAHAFGEANSWDDGLAATEKALAASPENPAALIERAELSAKSGRVVPNDKLGDDLRRQMDALVTEGGKPLADQTRGVSPEQVALAELAIARVQLARGDVPGALAAAKAASALGLDDQRVVEGILAMFLLLDDNAHVAVAAPKMLDHLPNSRLMRIQLAQAQTALGRPDEALAALAKSGEVTTLPIGLVARADAKAASGDPDGARTDYDLALKRERKLESAMLGRVALDLAAGKLDDAHRTIDSRFLGKDAVASIALTTAYASVLRATGDPAERDKAKALLLRVTAGPLTPAVVRAKVELARVYRDAGDLRAARDAYGEAASAGSLDARLDSALLLIEDRDPKAGYDSLEALVKSLGDAVPAPVLLEAARAAMLVGDHAGALAHLDAADKTKGVMRWQLDRERGRLAFRRGDQAGAAQALTRALDGCGVDAETFLLAADVVYADIAASDEKTPPKLADLAAKVTALAADRMLGHPEGAIVAGILDLAAGKTEDAIAQYKKASDQLDAEKATSRRHARASYGFAILAYTARNLPEAKTQLDIVLGQDPASYSAYLYRADVLGEKKDAKGALADAQMAVAYNPDLVDGWYFVGKYAHDTGDKKLQEDAIGKLGAIAPDSPHLRELQLLK